MGRFIEFDRWTALAFGISATLVCLPYSRFGPSLLEQLLGMSLGGGIELGVQGLGYAVMIGFYAYRRIPTDPDDREWIPGE